MYLFHVICASFYVVTINKLERNLFIILLYLNHSVQLCSCQQVHLYISHQCSVVLSVEALLKAIADVNIANKLCYHYATFAINTYTMTSCEQGLITKKCLAMHKNYF